MLVLPILLVNYISLNSLKILHSLRLLLNPYNIPWRHTRFEKNFYLQTLFIFVSMTFEFRFDQAQSFRTFQEDPRK